MPPLPPSSVDTALSATSEVDGVTVTVISSPAFAAAVTSPLSSAAIVAIAVVRSVVPRERSARCRNDHKPSSFRFAATALLLSADDSSCRKRDNMKSTACVTDRWTRDRDRKRESRDVVLSRPRGSLSVTIVAMLFRWPYRSLIFRRISGRRY